jgi:hypothetical protein
MTCSVKLIVNFLREFGDVFCQTRFVSRSGVFVQNAFIYSLINQRDRRREKLGTRRFVVTCDGGAQLLDRCAKRAAIATIDLVALCVLPDALFC